jgi:class 3 adenylate cyclase
VTQQVGYLPVIMADGLAHPVETLFTQLLDTVTGDVLGALIIGFPAALERAAEGQVLTGILADGQLFSSETNETIRTDLRKRLDGVLAAGPEHAEFEGDLAGEPFLGFARRLRRGEAFPPSHQVSVYSMAEARREQGKMRTKIIGFGLLAMVGSLGVCVLLSHGLTGPIDDLVRGTREVRQGNFKHTVRVRSRDEIGQLAGSFNEMAKGLADKEYYRSVLDKVADPSVAAELAGGKIALGGEIRQVSVLFCDIRGFTKLTENMAPGEVIHMLNEHFTPLTRVVDECHGMVDKFVGDLVMAVFGAPKSYGDDAVNAARCARRMIEERLKLNQTSRYQIEVGIGVASGPAVAGNMGSEKRLNYTVLGERVNLAARLCSKAGRMEVMIDQTTRDFADAFAQIEPMAPLELKGFSAPVPAYKLVAIQAVNQA